MIGQGAFGQVYRAKHKASGATVAIKSYDRARLLKTNFRFDALREEIKVLSKLNHPNLIHLYNALEKDPAKVHLITDYVAGRSLNQHIRKMHVGSRMHEEECKKILR